MERLLKEVVQEVPLFRSPRWHEQPLLLVDARPPRVPELVAQRQLPEPLLPLEGPLKRVRAPPCEEGALPLPPKVHMMRLAEQLQRQLVPLGPHGAKLPVQLLQPLPQ